MVVFEVEKSKLNEVKRKLEEDNIVSRQTLKFRDATSLGLEKDVYYIVIEGSNEAIDRAREIIKSIGSEVTGKEADTILNKIKEQESAADQGFGSLFG